MSFRPTLGPARPAASPLALATFALIWAAAFGLLAAGYADAAYDAAHWHGPASPAATPTSAGTLLGLAAPLAYVAAVGAAVAGTVLLLPVFGLTWLALPRRERRTFPAVAALWAATVATAFASPALPPALASAAATVGLVAPLLVTGEVLRSVATALVHALGAGPAGSARDV